MVRLTVVLFLLACLPGCYLIKQGVKVIHYTRSAEENSRLLADPATPPRVKQFLQRVAEIRQYARDSIGLKESKNYTRFVSTDRTYLLDVVSACRPDTFAQYRWKYPFFGSFPYKGFFDKEDAQKTRDRLARKGYDVYMRRSSAFSTLGYFVDPLYSYMMDYSTYALANLIFHEETHATLYLKSRTRFNEELAVFVGRTAALDFVRKKYGKESDEYTRALARVEARERFYSLIRMMYHSLDSMYTTIPRAQERLSRKKRIIDEYQAFFSARYDSLFPAGNYASLKTRTINNAYIMAYMTYGLDLAIFARLYQAHENDLTAMLTALRPLADMRNPDPRTYMHALLDSLRQ